MTKDSTNLVREFLNLYSKIITDTDKKQKAGEK